MDILFWHQTTTSGRMELQNTRPHHLHLSERFKERGIGESLVTLFASLTYAYHCLMTLIK